MISVLRNLFGKVSIQWLTGVLFVTITLLLIFQLDYYYLRAMSGYSVYWMFFTLLAGIFFLIVGSDRLLYLSFGCAAIMAIFLMRSFNTNLRLADMNDGHSITLLFVNPNLSNDIPDLTYKKIQSTDADVVVLEELSPDWLWICESLKFKYPFQLKDVRIDPLGKAILSKFPYFKEEKVELFNIPILKMYIPNLNKDSLVIVASNTLPSFTMSAFQKMNVFLDSLAMFHSESQYPQLLAADFNLIPWSKELLGFKAKTGLISSRRDNNQGNFSGSIFSFLHAPNNEIFYSKHMECARFSIVEDEQSNPIGLFGRYQIKN